MEARVEIDLRQEARSVALAIDVPHLLCRAAIPTWRIRMINEYMSSSVFASLADQIETLGSDSDMVARCREFSEEEKRHGILCGAVVEALGGQAQAVAPEPPEFPSHADAAPREAVLRNLLSICCLSETVAVALIGADRLAMPKGALRDLLSEIYADEIGHARFGWLTVATALSACDADARIRLGHYLRVAFAYLEAHQLAHIPASSVPPEGGEALGLCDGAHARMLFYDTVREIIVPGLARLGLDAGRAWNERRPT